MPKVRGELEKLLNGYIMLFTFLRTISTQTPHPESVEQGQCSPDAVLWAEVSECALAHWWGEDKSTGDGSFTSHGEERGRPRDETEVQEFYTFAHLNQQK